MTQRPAGEITLRSAEGTRAIDVEHRDLYRVAVAQFHRSLSDDQEPAATGIDGYRSLVAALSLVKSAEAGGHVTVPSRFAE
jgi:1,5-anhydro-D-fructose reductase (1,5-anhydro-D-mannitol-forming)